jgi:hypothetical protein
VARIGFIVTKREVGMKLLKGALVVAFVFAVTCFVSGSSFAEKKCGEKGKDGKECCGKGKDCCKKGKEGKGSPEAKIKALNDSAAALEKTNPELAKELKAFADEKTKEAQEWKARKERYEARTKLLKDSAAALEKSNPKLAKELKGMCNSKHKKEAMEEMNEKEEAGEKVEPKNEANENKKK